MQTFTDWELILVDDASTDGSADLIASVISAHPDQRIRLIRLPGNSGAAAARNAGIQQAEGRYLAFLDADDIWYKDKLSDELLFMEKYRAGFVFTSYEFGDENAVPTGKRVRVPLTLTYREALSRTVIFTSTVIIDRKIVPNIRMPQVPSEDTATWWEILRSGVTGYGLDKPLTIYRRPARSLSSNKGTAVKRIWNLYRREGLSFAASAFHLGGWAYRAFVRRTVDDAVRRHLESLRRILVLQLSLIGLILHTALYAAVWFNYLYPELHQVRISQKGYDLGVGLTLYFRGHMLILGLYFVLLIFLSQTSGGMKTGYLKPANVFSSEVTALILTNILTYFQLSLMNNWLMKPVPFLLLSLVQILIAAGWSFLSDRIYRAVFPPKETLVADLDGDGAGRLIARLGSRNDRFRIMRVMSRESMADIKSECLRWYGCVVIAGGTEEERRELVDFCYRRFIRVYLLPDISDILIQGTELLDLFDTPILSLREYTIRWEARTVKRLVDILISLPVCMVLAIRSLAKKGSRIRCVGRNGKEFTKTGKGWLNILKGQMSLVGPEALSVEAARRLERLDERSHYRYRIKPGLTGYAQLYRNEETDPLDQLKMDLYYIQHYSLLGDFKLLLQSIR